MSRRGTWGAMADRVASGRPAVEPERPQPSAPEPPQPPHTVKHCWVVDEHGTLPALLLEWRRTAAGFQGRVVHPVEEPEIGWVLVEEWLPAERLAPAATEPPARTRPPQ